MTVIKTWTNCVANGGTTQNKNFLDSHVNLLDTIFIFLIYSFKMNNLFLTIIFITICHCQQWPSQKTFSPSKYYSLQKKWISTTIMNANQSDKSHTQCNNIIDLKPFRDAQYYPWVKVIYVLRNISILLKYN